MSDPSFRDRVRVLWEESPCGVLVGGADSGVIEEANPEAVRLWGAGLETLRGRRWEEVLERAEGDRATLCRPDGARAPVRVRWVRAVRDGRPVEVAFLEDLGEVERLREELGEAQALMERIRDGANDGMALLDERGVYVWVNRKQLEIGGRRREDYVGRNWKELSPPEMHATYQAYFDRLLAGESVRMKTRLRDAGGRERIVDVSSAPVFHGGRTYVLAIVRDVTEEERAASALQAEIADRLQAEAKWRSLVENVPDFILTLDREGRITFINRTAPGGDRNEVVGRPAVEFIPEEFRAASRALISEVFSTGREGEQVVAAPLPDGQTAWYAVRLAPILRDGTVQEAVCIARDITEQRRAEQRAALEHAVTKSLAESSTLAEAAPKILRMVCEGLEWDVGALWAVDEGASLLRCREFAARGGKAFARFEEETRRRGFASGEGLPGRVWACGEPRWIEDVTADPNFPRAAAAREDGLRGAFAFPVRGGAGVLGVVEFFSREARRPDAELLRLVTSLGTLIGQFVERTRAEEELRFRTTLLEAQSEASIEGILVVSADGRMISFNRRFVEMWEIPERVIRSRSDEEALQSVLDKVVDSRGFMDRVRAIYARPEATSRDEILLRDGRVFERYSAPVRSAAGVYYGRVWFFRDVTGRKRTEEELRRAADETRRAYEDLKRAQAQLIRSEKLASIGMLVSGVAHEINNPLNVIYGNLKLLAGKGVFSARKLRGMLRDSLRAAEQARRIVEEFRSFARDTRTAELVDLNECLEETVAVFQRELDPRLTLEKRLGRVPPVRCFRGQINQVFLNLLKNAAEAIEGAGRIVLRSGRRGSWGFVEVVDTGRGIAPEVREKLFEPFFTTKPVGRGLGLGLSISAMIVHNHGGRISARSRPGRGATFRVELPAAPSAAGRRKVHP